LIVKKQIGQTRKSIPNITSRKDTYLPLQICSSMRWLLCCW